MLEVGSVFADRFEVERLAGAGGMGSVCKATDITTGQAVALKVLHLQSDAYDGRFEREAQVLSTLAHPAIVRYVSHGAAANGVLYLAMEWLEGEDLGHRLDRGGLRVSESLALIRRVASALAVAHAQGVIHRDIKPGNLHLVDGDPQQVKVLDFGIARPALTSRALTRTGALVGTLGYVAPEQASGESDIDSRIDVFSLGCVFFECLTGQVAFYGARPVAVLAKILFGEMPRPRSFRPDISPELDALVARMMAREREERFVDGAAVVEALDALEHRISAPPPVMALRRRVLTAEEQRFLSIMLVSPLMEDSFECHPTVTPEQAEDVVAPIRAVVEPLGGRVSSMASGAVLVLLHGQGTARDLAARAAACALQVRQVVPEMHISLATGPVEVTSAWPSGEVIDRAASLQTAAAARGAMGVCIDDITAALLDTRFDIHVEGDVRLLLGNRCSIGVRRLLGKPTPCVGRAKEFAFLEGALEDCIDDPVATPVLITGPAGCGKTRLAHEFLNRVCEQDNSLRVLTARGDPVSAGSAFSLVSQLVRDATGLAPGGDKDQQRSVLQAVLEPHFAGDDLSHMTEFLGEMIGTPATAAPSPLLVAARNDARIMNAQLRATFVDLIGALCTSAPRLIVLDDLHWGDLPSLTFLHSSLRSHSELPLMVLALARPRVLELFPELWSGTGLQRLGLGGLKRRAAEKLARSALGDGVDQKTIHRTVERSGGNPFFLEELIRHIAERGPSPQETAELPGSILAMVQSRLEALDPEARRVLRAGSVFGMVFWEDGLAALLGEVMSSVELREWLEVLVRKEIIELAPTSRFAGHQGYAFRQDLLREGAYAMLTETDRALGHRLAAKWLIEVDEPDPLVLADHLEKGGEPKEALPYLIRAAEAAFHGGHLEATLALADRGLALGAVGFDLGMLRLYQAGSALWLGDFSELSGNASEAVSLLPTGSADWFMALAGLAFAGSFGGDAEALRTVIELLGAFEGDLPAIGPVGYSAHALHASLIHSGRPSEARALSDRLERGLERVDAPDPVYAGYCALLEGWLALWGLADLGRALPSMQKARECFDIGRNRFSLLATGYGLSSALWTVGDFQRAEETCRAVIAQCRQQGVPLFERWSSWVLGEILASTDRPDEAISLLRPLLEEVEALLALVVRLTLAASLVLAERLDEALAEVEIVCAAHVLPPRRADGLALKARIFLKQGDAEAALELGREALETMASVGGQPLYESVARLTVAEARIALGDHLGADRALAEARGRLFAQADSIGRPGLGERFLSAFPFHVQTLELAAQRLGPAD